LIVAQTENGNASLMLPSGTDSMQPMFRSLPVAWNSDRCSSLVRFIGSFSETRLLNEHQASMVVFQNEESVPLQQPVSPDCVSLGLVEESNTDGGPLRGILRRNSSSRLHSSLSGNPVRQPEQEDLAAMAPTLVLAAAEPHISLDSNKPRYDAAVGEDSSMTAATSHNSISETFCKSNR